MNKMLKETKSNTMTELLVESQNSQTYNKPHPMKIALKKAGIVTYLEIQ